MKKSGVLDLVKFGFNGFKKNPIMLVPLLIMVLIGIAALLLMGLIFLTSGMVSISELGVQINTGITISMIFLMGLKIALVGIVAILISLPFHLGIMGMGKEISLGKKAKFNAVNKYAKKFYLRSLGVYILIGLIAAAAAIILISLGRWITLLARVAQDSAGGQVIMAIVIGILVLFMVLFALAPYYLIFQDLKIIKSIKKGFQIARKYYWVLLGVLVIFMIISLVIRQLTLLGAGWIIVVILLNMVLSLVQIVALMKFISERK